MPLSASSVRKLTDLLATILDDAVENEHIDRNPARGKRMRIRVPKPSRSFLEMDDLAEPGEYVGRRAVIEILGRSGVRASELCDLRVRDVRLHDPVAPASGFPMPRPRPGSARCR